MSSSALSILHGFHRHLQHSTQSGVKHFHGRSHATIASYAARFNECLPKTSTRVANEAVLAAALSTDLVLFGDFHTLPQSQLAFLELLKRAYRHNAGRSLCVALEIFAASDQPHIDDYISGRMPEEYFLKRTDYHNKWGFPWENYRPIVDFCAQNKIPIIGINCHTDSQNRLAKRDSFAAEIIGAAKKKSPETLVLCLIGEYHLADQHLPQALKDHSIVRIVNNIDDYSLSSFDEPLSNFETLKLRDDFFCILNTAPWLKWQSLAMWEELHGAGEHGFYGSTNEAYTEQEYDVEYQLLFILKAMNEFLGLGIASSDLSFDIYMKPDRATLSYLRSKFGLSRQNLTIAERRLYQDGLCYIPRTKAILLREFSMHHLLEAAGFILLDCLQKNQANQNGFSQRVHYQVCGALCGLIMNPRRDLHSLGQVEDALLLLQRKRLLGESRKYREAYKMVRDFHRYGFDGLVKVTKSTEECDRDSNFLLSRILGETIAHQIFKTVLGSDAAELKKGLKALFMSDLPAQLAYLETEAPEPLRSAS